MDFKKQLMNSLSNPIISEQMPQLPGSPQEDKVLHDLLRMVLRVPGTWETPKPMRDPHRC